VASFKSDSKFENGESESSVIDLTGAHHCSVPLKKYSFISNSVPPSQFSKKCLPKKDPSVFPEFRKTTGKGK